MKTVAIIANGPSLTPAQVNYLRGRALVIAVSDAYRLAPWADIVYSSCKPWWDVHRDNVDALGVTGELWTQSEDAAQTYALERIPHRGGGEGLVSWTCCGGCSGEHATHLAVWRYELGAGDRIILVGHDMGATGRGHWFGDHPAPLVNGADFPSMLKTWPALARDMAARGIDVVNCTTKSAIDCFPKQELAVAC